MLHYFGKSFIFPTGFPPNNARQSETPFSVPNIHRLDYTYILMLPSTPFTVLSCAFVFCCFALFCFFLDYRFSGGF